MQKAAPRLERYGLRVHEADWEDAVLDLVERVPFGVVVAGYPLRGAGFGLLLSAVRARSSACRRAGFVAVTPPDRFDEASRLVGRGVNKVLSETAPPHELGLLVTSLLDAPPRLPVRVQVRITVQQEDGQVEVLCQTENISTSGMLLRRRSISTPGTRIDFQIQLPGREEMIQGSAEVARVADPDREGLEGFAARFLDFDGSSREEWESFLEAWALP
jgi:PilZ domain